MRLVVPDGSALAQEIDSLLAGLPSQAASRPARPKGEPLAKPETLHGLPKPLPLGDVYKRQVDYIARQSTRR